MICFGEVFNPFVLATKIVCPKQCNVQEIGEGAYQLPRLEGGYSTPGPQGTPELGEDGEAPPAKDFAGCKIDSPVGTGIPTAKLGSSASLELVSLREPGTSLKSRSKGTRLLSAPLLEV